MLSPTDILLVKEIINCLVNDGIVVTNMTSADLSAGVKIVADDAIPEVLIAGSTPCKYIWLAARMDADGIALNTKPCFVGTVDSQTIPIVPSNLEGILLPIRDASLLYVKVGFDGEGISYVLFI
jgi:hypothetical protein